MSRFQIFPHFRILPFIFDDRISIIANNLVTPIIIKGGLIVTLWSICCWGIIIINIICILYFMFFILIPVSVGLILLDKIFCYQCLMCRMWMLECFFIYENMFFCYQDSLYRLVTLDSCDQATVFCYQILLYKRDLLGLNCLKARIFLLGQDL